MTTELSVDAQIALVEKRMELRRERIVIELAQTRVEAQRKAAKLTAWLPLAGTASALVIGFFIARHRFRPAPAVAVPLRQRTPPPAATRSIVATVIALGAAALRFANSAEARLLLNAFRAARARGARAPR